MTTLKAVTPIQRDTLELEDRLELLLADIRANEVLGLAFVIHRTDGQTVTWYTGPDKLKLAGGLGALQHTIYCPK